MHQNKWVTRCLFCTLLGLVLPAAAQSGSQPSGEDSAAFTKSLPAYNAGTPEADGRPGQYYFGIGAQAFTHHDYSYAINMYEVAASWAYKPAEYDLGVMYARGQGIPVDLPRAMAWMALAAERGDRGYVHARDVVRASLTPAQLADADVILQQLTPRYGDKVALRRAKDRWAQVRSSMTGSRVGSMASTMVSGAPKPGPATANPKFGGAAVVATNGAEATGSQNSDGSESYQQLAASDNPYDKKFDVVTGTATVGPLTSVPADEATDAAKPKPKDADGQPER